MQNHEVLQNPLAVDSVWKLLGKYAIPCVISLLVNSLYNMVDQIFIGQGVGYLGNGATNIIYPLTVIVLSIALMLGDGGASFLSLRLGEGKKEEGAKGIGSVITFSVVVGIIIAVPMAVFLEDLVYLVPVGLKEGGGGDDRGTGEPSGGKGIAAARRIHIADGAVQPGDREHHIAQEVVRVFDGAGKAERGWGVA